MGATSVTGTGPGAANVTRGPGNLRNQYASLLDAHIVAHGTIYSNLGNVTVDLESNVWDVPENLTIICTSKSYAVDKNTGEDGICTGFTIFGAKKVDIDYVVIKSPSGGFTNDF